LRENQARPNSVINVLVKGGTPFPYKVAKALDPRMYRNVEYDLWNDERKGEFPHLYSIWTCDLFLTSFNRVEKE
jgi:hypothetical protein